MVSNSAHFPALQKERVTAEEGSLAERRVAALRALLHGFYISTGRATERRFLHFLGACWRVPSVDNFDFEFLGMHQPNKDRFDLYCSCCAKNKQLK